MIPQKQIDYIENLEENLPEIEKSESDNGSQIYTIKLETSDPDASAILNITVDNDGSPLVYGGDAGGITQGIGFGSDGGDPLVLIDSEGDVIANGVQTPSVADVETGDNTILLKDEETDGITITSIGDISLAADTGQNIAVANPIKFEGCKALGSNDLYFGPVKLYFTVEYNDGYLYIPLFADSLASSLIGMYSIDPTYDLVLPKTLVGFSDAVLTDEQKTALNSIDWDSATFWLTSGHTDEDDFYSFVQPYDLEDYASKVQIKIGNNFFRWNSSDNDIVLEGTWQNISGNSAKASIYMPVQEYVYFEM